MPTHTVDAPTVTRPADPVCKMSGLDCGSLSPQREPLAPCSAEAITPAAPRVNTVWPRTPGERRHELHRACTPQGIRTPARRDWHEYTVGLPQATKFGPDHSSRRPPRLRRPEPAPRRCPTGSALRKPRASTGGQKCLAPTLRTEVSGPTTHKPRATSRQMLAKRRSTRPADRRPSGRDLVRPRNQANQVRTVRGSRRTCCRKSRSWS